ncbi:MAG TPA: hypothetical protein VFA12_20405 [Stellaceae bacterium]|nr:hypothetical protein [Stellaceae bacterium]
MDRTTIALARSIPRPARVAQGCSQIRQMAELIAQRRSERAARAKAARTANRHGMGRRVWKERIHALQAIIDARPDLRRDARRAAGLLAHDSRPVVVSASVYRRGRRAYTPTELGSGYDFRWRGQWKTAPGSYIPSDRRVAVPAGWLALRLLREAERMEAAQ